MTSTGTESAEPTDPPEEPTASSPPEDTSISPVTEPEPDGVHDPLEAGVPGAAQDTVTSGSVESGTAAAQRQWSRPVRIGALVLAILVPSALAALAFSREHSSRDTLDAQSSARDAACAYAKALTNYDAQSIDTYVATVLAGATGDFKTEFGKTSNELKDVIVQAKIQSQNRDARCGVETVSDTHADVVVAMSVSISSLGTQGKPVPSQISLVASLDKVDGHWLVSKLDAPALQPLQAADPAAAAPAK
ncbi:hypothetical protein [Nocardia sp. NPDC006630]|uniref:hypothetical protein n=1 Tax=Nocardia sp. NPDC006630 TaxID=3157181 RepID=UPI0033B4BB9E